MPSTSDARDLGIAASMGTKHTRLDVHFTATFTTIPSAAAIQLRFADRAPGEPFERSRHEIRVLSGGVPVLVIGMQLRARSAGRGFAVKASKVSHIDPPAVDDDPSFPRDIDHGFSRSWSLAAADGGDIVQHNVVLDVAADALGEHVVTQTALVKNDDVIEVVYKLAQAGQPIGSGVVRMQTVATVEGGLVLGEPVVDDDFT